MNEESGSPHPASAQADVVSPTYSNPASPQPQSPREHSGEDGNDNLPQSPGLAEGDVAVPVENAEAPEISQEVENAEVENAEEQPAVEETETEVPKSPVASNDSPEDKNPNADNNSDDDTPSPTKRRAVVDSDDEDEAPKDDDNSSSPQKKRRARIDSDESGDEKEKEEGEQKVTTRKLLGSDVSDSDDDEDRPRGEEEVGELMANIFGDDSDEEGAEKDGGEKGEGEGKEGEDEDEDQGYRRDDREDEPGFEWDFDAMLRDKKASKKKRRKRDGGIDIINDDDGTVAMLIEAMKAATKADRHSNMERKPALRKRKMLSEVKVMLLRMDMMEAMIDNGMLSAVSDWLSPLPDKSLPALEIRTEILKLLQGFTRLEQSILKQSGLGKAVMMLYKHPRETKENKEVASKLIREWARPIFQLETDFRSVSKEERVQRDLDHMPQVKKRRTSTEGNTAGTSGTGSVQDDLRPGDKGYIGRARVPRPSTRDYVVRPRSTVDGEFKGERKGKAFNRLDKTQRDFMERTRKHKAKRAIQVSLEGRNLAL